MLHISRQEALERGRHSQRRFFEAVGFMRSRFTPSWFIGIIPADFEYDLRGVDAIAYITYPGDTWASRIPIQIKSSWTGYWAYKEKHAKYGGENVVIAVMRDEISNDAIRATLYDDLNKIREENVRFDEYFQNLFAHPISTGAERIRQRLIRAKTCQYSARMHRLLRASTQPVLTKPCTPVPLPLPIAPPQPRKRWWWPW